MASSNEVSPLHPTPTAVPAPPVQTLVRRCSKQTHFPPSTQVPILSSIGQGYRALKSDGLKVIYRDSLLGLPRAWQAGPDFSANTLRSRAGSARCSSASSTVAAFAAVGLAPLCRKQTEMDK